MNYVQRLLLRTKIKKIIRRTYDVPTVVSFLSTVEVFRKLDNQTLYKLWQHEIGQYMLFGDSLDAVLHASEADGVIRQESVVPVDEQALADPLEWLTGNKRHRVLHLISNPNTRSLADMSLAVWYTNVRADFSVLTIDQVQGTDVAIRRVLKGVVECL